MADIGAWSEGFRPPSPVRSYSAGDGHPPRREDTGSPLSQDPDNSQQFQPPQSSRSAAPQSAPVSPRSQNKPPLATQGGAGEPDWRGQLQKDGQAASPYSVQEAGDGDFVRGSQRFSPRAAFGQDKDEQLSPRSPSAKPQSPRFASPREDFPAESARPDRSRSATPSAGDSSRSSTPTASTTPRDEASDRGGSPHGSSRSHSPQPSRSPSPSLSHSSRDSLTPRQSPLLKSNLLGSRSPSSSRSPSPSLDPSAGDSSRQSSPSRYSPSPRERSPSPSPSPSLHSSVSASSRSSTLSRRSPSPRDSPSPRRSPSPSHSASSRRSSVSRQSSLSRQSHSLQRTPTPSSRARSPASSAFSDRSQGSSRRPPLRAHSARSFHSSASSRSRSSSAGQSSHRGNQSPTPAQLAWNSQNNFCSSADSLEDPSLESGMAETGEQEKKKKSKTGIQERPRTSSVQRRLIGGKYEEIRQKGRTRYFELAKPKLPKSDWWTCIYPDVMWGTQDMLYPIPNAALSANASERVTTLATPKKNFQKGTVYEHKPLFLYSCGRPSQIWQVSSGAKQGVATARVEELAQAKAFHPDHKPNRPHFTYSCGRESAIWLVSPGAKECRERPRTSALAEARPSHREFLGARSIETVIPQTALNGKIHDPDYLNLLAQPKRRQEVQFRESQWEVSQTARKAAATPRLVELARPKGLVEGYQLPRGEMSDVSKAARRAVCSTRVTELSRPIERASMDHLQFNPDAFLVKTNALKGVFPNRVNDLAQPIQR